ncbi:hypothetical protein [Herminiimonas sp. CN]|nr:hypothetical protein [Herminiimonas sp. CN]
MKLNEFRRTIQVLRVSQFFYNVHPSGAFSNALAGPRLTDLAFALQSG